MHLQAKLPEYLYPEAVQTAGYILNQILVKKLNWKSPIKSALGIKPQLAYLYPFSCRAYLLNKHILKLNKLKPRAYISYLVGYNSSNIFRV